MNKYIKWLKYLFMSDEDKCKEVIGKTIKVIHKDDNPFKEDRYFYIRITEVKNKWCKYNYYDNRGCGIREETQMCKKMIVYFKNKSKWYVSEIVDDIVWHTEENKNEI